MGLQTISILKSMVFFFAFLFPAFVGIPKGMKYWEQWKKTKKTMFLSGAITFFMGSVFFYIAALIIVIMGFLGIP